MLQMTLECDGLRPHKIQLLKASKTQGWTNARALQPERRVTYSDAKFFEGGLHEFEAEEEMDDQQTEKADDQMEVDRKGKDAADNRSRSRSPKQVKKKPKADEWEHGGKLIDNAGKGDCLYHARSFEQER